ncbi:protein rep, partial [Salmonella enterica subsp. enterica serovar Kentucky]|nr:protein rep [Salmonella enterica subsp. enterica serovar Kentucky]
TKPADMVADPEWFLELTRQTHKRRFVATGGALKDVLKLEQETDQDMYLAWSGYYCGTLSLAISQQ